MLLTTFKASLTEQNYKLEFRYLIPYNNLFFKRILSYSVCIGLFKIFI